MGRDPQNMYYNSDFLEFCQRNWKKQAMRVTYQKLRVTGDKVGPVKEVAET